MHPTEEQLEQLRNQFGEVVAKKMGDTTVVFRPPTEAEWFMCTDTVTNDKKSRSKALKAVALSCVVFPDRKSASEHMSRKPNRFFVAANIVEKLAGDEDEEDPGEYAEKKDTDGSDP